MKGFTFADGLKPHGRIIRKTHHSLRKQEQPSIEPLANLATITSNNSSIKVPGEIKAIVKPAPAQVD